MKTLMIGAAAVAVSAGAASAAVTNTFFAEALNIDISAWNSGAPLPGNPDLDNVVAARSAFLANFTTFFEEDFEDVPVGPAAGGVNLNFGSINASLTGPGEVREFPPGLNNRFATSGERYFDTQANPNDPTDSSPPFTVTFDQPIAAFGFYATDVGDFGGQIELILDGNAVDVINVPNFTGSNGSTDPSVLFFGFTSDVDFNEIVFTSTAEDADGFGFDDMVFGRRGQIIPLPGASMLAMAGLVGIAGIRRR